MQIADEITVSFALDNTNEKFNYIFAKIDKKYKVEIFSNTANLVYTLNKNELIIKSAESSGTAILSGNKDLIFYQREILIIDPLTENNNIILNGDQIFANFSEVIIQIPHIN